MSSCPSANITHWDIREKRSPLQPESEHVNSSHTNWHPIPCLHLGEQMQEADSLRPPRVLPETQDWKEGASSPGSVALFMAKTHRVVFLPALKASCGQEKQAFESRKWQHLTPGLFRLAVSGKGRPCLVPGMPSRQLAQQVWAGVLAPPELGYRLSPAVGL